jgi:hypothetical protein
MKKKLLFLYPLEEDMKFLADNSPIEIFQNSINRRYREKGYEINYLIFPDKDLAYLDVYSSDKVILTDITYGEHINSIGKDEHGNDIYIYPSNNYIQSQLGEVDELIICGFHASDCVKRIAEYFCLKGINVLVDVELTDLFRYHCKSPYFKEDKYNLANIIQYLKVQNMSGGFCETTLEYNPDNLYGEPYYKKDYFTPTVSVDELLDAMEVNEENRKKQK